MTNEINIVIGSWGSYNACNEKSLGSEWLNLADFDSWEEIEQELKKQGFQLNGIDEELFIQDIEGINDDSTNWDFTNPKQFFETLKESGVLDDEYQLEVMQAYLECRSLSDFEELVNQYGSHWNDDIYLYRGFDWYDFGKENFDSCGYKIPEHIEQFIDFEAYGKYLGDYYAYEYSEGIIEICA